ncbi:MAG: sodium:proton antiporter [Wenzhouxiangellaceae bacterium]
MHLDSPAGMMLLILTSALASQWLAWRLRLPAIVVLIVSGLLLGPVFGLIRLETASEHLSELIGLGVAIILFEGGMDLKLGELKKAGKGILRLVLLGVPLAWVLTLLAAHYVVGLSWPVAVVVGAILVVTGPTVIMPVLRYARLNRQSVALLKWEGIVNDPIGVLLAVLSFQYFTIAGEGLGDTLAALGGAVLVAVVLGGGGGWAVARMYARGWVPEHLKPPLLLILVLAFFELSNLVQHEAGLLTVTAMGMVIGNIRLPGREDLERFKQNLTVLLVSVLFIVITARLEFARLAALDWRALLFVAALVLFIRPLSVWLATAGASLRHPDRVLLAWIAPRGIVAAATAGVFGPAMVEAGFSDAAMLAPLVFAVIVVTVLAGGFAIGPLSKRLKLAAPDDHGVLIVGASPWSTELAAAFRNQEVEVLLADGAWRRLRQARMSGIPVYYGELLSEHAEETLETHHLGYLLAASDNDFQNALVCKVLGPVFGHHRVFQLPLSEGAKSEQRQLHADQRGHFAFVRHATYDWLHQRLDAGWVFRTLRIREEHGDLDDLIEQRFGPVGESWLPIARLSPEGKPRFYSEELPFSLDADDRLLYFAPPPEESATEAAEVAASAAETARA